MEQTTMEQGARTGRGRGRGRSEASAAAPEGVTGGVGSGSTGAPDSGDTTTTEPGTGGESNPVNPDPAGAQGTMAPQAPQGATGPVNHVVGHGGMSAGGAPAGGTYDVGYDGDFSGGYASGGYTGDHEYGGGYAPQGYGQGGYQGGGYRQQGGYGRGGYGRGGYGRGSYNGGQAPVGYAGPQEMPQLPSQHHVREIGSRGIPVPPTYAEAQALLDSFEPSPNQQKRLDELGLTAATRGEAKGVLDAYTKQNPEILKVWEAENATAAVARRADRRGQQDPRVTSQGLFQLLADAGVTEIPRDHAAAAAIADGLPPSEEMVRVLREHGRQAPASRAEAREIIRGLPATPAQVQAIMRRTGGRWAPRTRGEAERWFQDNPLPAGNGGGYQGGGGYRGGYGRGGYGRGFQQPVAA